MTLMTLHEFLLYILQDVLMNVDNMNGTISLDEEVQFDFPFLSDVTPCTVDAVIMLGEETLSFSWNRYQDHCYDKGQLCIGHPSYDDDDDGKPASSSAFIQLDFAYCECCRSSSVTLSSAVETYVPSPRVSNIARLAMEIYQNAK